MRFSSHDQPPPSMNAEGGFSLVEVMVASAIMGMVIIGVMTLIGIGRGMEAETLLRSQALEMAASKLENPAYQNPLVGTQITPVDPEISSINLKTTSGVNLPGHMTLIISPVLDGTWPEIDGGPDVTVPYQRLTVTVQWTFAGVSDLVELKKRVSAIR